MWKGWKWLAVWVMCCGTFSSAQAKSRVVILGFDGMEPTIVDQMLQAGELPNFDKVRQQGTYQRLRSSNPPQSPTAWSSFATCKRPGNHGIYDFLRRDPKVYLPQVGFGAPKPPYIAPDGAMTRPPEYISYRKGESFWKAADRQGANCKVLLVPFAYPADSLEHGCMLCGLGVPDLRGTQSTFFSMSDSFTEAQLQEELSGGMRLPLKFEGDVATVMIPGIRNYLYKDPKKVQYIEVPLTITADRSNHRATVEIQGQKATLSEGEWSNWFEWTFDVTPQYQVRAISSVQIMEVGQQVRLYMTCLQYHPKAPYIPISTPPAYSGELADRYGLYKTIGWDYDTHALRQDALTEEGFLEDIRKTVAWRERLILDELGRGEFDLLVVGETAPDRVSHMFWRFRDPKHPRYTEEGAKKYDHVVEETYRMMDQIAGKVMEKLAPEDVVMILSDHGFHSFRKGFNVNTWLVRNGYLGLKGQTDAASAFTDKRFLQDFEWNRTKAYSLGLGSIFLNLKGREGLGTVNPPEVPALLAELGGRLLEVTDPETGDRVFRKIYTRDEYRGVAANDAPDLQLGYAEGYQTAKPSASGAAPKELFEPNNDKWSGEHAASDVEFTPGIFFWNKPLKEGQEPAIIDLGVTALQLLGLNVPQDFEGKSLL